MENSAHQQNPDIVFAIIGATGTGKSTFVDLLTHDRIGRRRESDTLDIQTANYADRTTGRSVMLIDTPGFDDSGEGITDTDVLRKIADYLEPSNGKGRKLDGVIYMHRISDPRVGGVSRRNVRMLYSLCGEHTLANVRIVTTHWSRVSEEEGNYQEDVLKHGAFKALIDAGAQMRRHANTLESARQIVSELIPLQVATLKIQEELRDGKELAAGMVLEEEMHEEMARKVIVHLQQIGECAESTRPCTVEVERQSGDGGCSIV